VAVDRNLFVHQLDISTAFLHGKLEEEVYVQQPEGFHVGPSGVACKLDKSLYGLKQAPRAWYTTLTGVLIAAGFEKSWADESLWIKREEGTSTYILIYVDDMLVASENLEQVSKAKDVIAGAFTMKDLGELKYFLGMQVTIVRDSKGVIQMIKLTNDKLITDLLSDFGMSQAKPKATPMDGAWKSVTKTDGNPLPAGNRYREVLGKLLYLANTVRPDISYPSGVLSRFASSPTHLHMQMAMGVLRYLVGTKDLGLVWVKGGNSSTVVGFCDSDFAGDCDTRKSTSGGVFLAGSAAISWISKLQQLAALSTVEAEFISMCQGVQEVLWLDKLASDFSYELGAVVLYTDNTGALVNVRGNPSSMRTKHIGVRYQRIRDEVQLGRVNPAFIPSEENSADLFTKALPKPAFTRLRDTIGLRALVVEPATTDAAEKT
jgi:hypothetical protein